MSEEPPSSNAAPSRRGPKPSLSVERIVRAAIDIAGEEGVDAVSMRRIAGELGAGTMSLYRYVRSKEELVDLMVDTALGEGPEPGAPLEGWRQHVEWCARQQWEVYLRHPWVLPLASTTRPSPSPTGILQMERVLAAMENLGIDHASRLHMYLSVTGYVQGVAHLYAREVEAERRTGVTAGQWWESHDPVFERIFATRDFPAIERFHWEGLDTVPEAWFEFGLQRLLDGFEALIERERAGRSA